MNRLIFACSVALLAAMTSFPATAQEAEEPTAGEAAANPAPATPRRVPATVPMLRRVINEAYAKGEYGTFRQAVLKLREMRPWNAEYMALEVIAHALNEDKSRGYEMMLTMQRQGLSYDFNASEGAKSLRGTEAYDYINDLLVRQGEPAGQAELRFELPADVLLPTAITWDPTREAFLVADARAGAVRQVSPEGEVTELIRADADNGLWSIFGLLVDPENDRLWVTTAANPNFVDYQETDEGRSALVEFTLGELELVRKYPVPADGRPHRLGELARGSDGAIYAVDTILPVIYRLEAGADRLKPFLASSDNVSLRGVTTSGDGRVIYVADREMGIMALDIEGKKAMRVTGPENLNFGGIEGLFWWKDHLVMIQNGNAPQRIMRLSLADDGTTVEEVAPLAIAQPFFDFPNFGTVVGDDLVFLANSHWVQGGEEVEPVRVAATGIAVAPNLMAPDVEKFWDEYYEKTGKRPMEGQ